MQIKKEINLESLPTEMLSEILGYFTLDSYFAINQANKFFRSFTWPEDFWKRKYEQLIDQAHEKGLPGWKEAFFTNFNYYENELDKRDNCINIIIKDDNIRLLTKFTRGMNKDQFLEYITTSGEELEDTLFYAQKYHCIDILNHIYQVVTADWLDPHALDKTKKSILYWAVNCNQSYERIDDFIKRGVKYLEGSPVNKKQEYLDNLDVLQVAIRRNDPAIMQLFWEKLVHKNSKAFCHALLTEGQMKESLYKQIMEYLLKANKLDKDSLGQILIKAAVCGNQSVVKMLLDWNFNDKAILDQAFAFAAGGGHVEILEQLYQKKVNVNVPFGLNSPLHKAIASLKLPAVIYLLEKGAMLQALDGEDTPSEVIMAAHPDRSGMIPEYLRKVTIVEQTIKKKKMVRAWQEIVKLLLEYDLESLNKIGKWGNTLLGTAASHGDLTLLEHLLEKGANADQLNSFGAKALDIAIQQNHQQAAELLLARTSLDTDYYSLSRAIEADRVDMVKWLLERSPGALFDSRHIKSPLSIAWEKNLACLPFVLQAMSGTEDMMPYLFMATQDFRVDIVKQILAMDASKINSRCNSKGQLILHVAAAGGSSEIVALLLNAGSNPFFTIAGAAANMTAREVARQHGHKDIYQILFNAEMELQRKAAFFQPVLLKRKGEDGDDNGNAKRPRI